METPILHGIKYNVHTVFQCHPPETLKTISRHLAIPVHLLLLNLDGNMNIAMSIRTAAVLGCSDVWVVGKRKYDARPEVGAKNYIRVHKEDSIDPTTFFAEKGLQPILVEQGGTPLEQMKFAPYIKTNPVCFVMGSESHGISPEWLTLLSGEPRVSISQCGMVRSLNVSIAASIVLYEYMKQYRALSAYASS
jgi:tRNA G18 (ribose-2'-O)-methylase SpoU